MIYGKKQNYLSRGLRFEYEIWEEPKFIPEMEDGRTQNESSSEKTLVFLHGMGGSIEQIRKIYEAIPGVRVIVPNQQGHGGSEADWETLDFERMADDIIALLDQLQIQKACFAGISMGAAVCLNIAVRYPRYVEQLFLIRNAWMEHPMEEDRRKAYADMGKCLQEGGIEAFYKTEGWEIVKEPSAYTRTAFTCTFEDPCCLKHWQKFLILPSKAPVKTVEDLQGIQMPAVIIANKNDFCHPFVYGLRLHELIKGSEFFEIPDKDLDGAAHNREINRIMQRKLQEL